MTLSFLQVLSVLLVPGLLGAALLRLQAVALRTDPIAYCGWAWMQGSLGIAAVLSAWLWLELPLSAAWIAPLLLALAGSAFFFGRRIPLVEVSASVRHPAWERLLFALALAFLLLTTVDRILIASADVLVGADEARIWAAKAKVMFHSAGFGAEYLARMRMPEVISHEDYPPLNPLLQLWVHLHAGEIVHVESRLPLQAFGLAGILVAASAARRRARPLVAALFLVCIGTLGRFYTYQVYSDALIALALLACWDLWQRFQEDGALVWLRLLGTLAPLLVWSKNEGSLHVLVFGMALLVAISAKRVRLPERGERLRCLAWSVPLVASVSYLRWFNGHFGFVNAILQGSAAGPEEVSGRHPSFVSLAREQASDSFRPILGWFARLLVDAELTHYLLVAFLVLCVVSPGSALRGRLVFTLSLLLGLLGYMAIYLGTFWDLENHLKHSAHRLIYHLTPAAGLWVLVYVVEVLPRLSSFRGREAPDSPGSGPARATMPSC